MTEIDFLEPTVLETLLRSVEGFRRRHAIDRVAAAAFAAIGLAAAFETWRVVASLQAAAQMESHRDALRARVAAVEARIRRAKTEQESLDEILAVRRNSMTASLAVLRVGNAIGTNIGLTALRRVPQGIEMEGRSPAFSSIPMLVQRVSAARAGTIASFETRAEEDEASSVWFRIGLHRDNND